MKGRLVQLVPVGLDRADYPHLPWLGAALASRAGLIPVEGDALEIDPAWNEFGTLRCSSNRIVDALIARDVGDPDRPSDWTLALTSRDLGAPGRDYVFGEATLGGAWAVISAARLREDTDPADDLLRARLLKEALHELGHLSGLSHCVVATCVMAPSSVPRDVDAKSDVFCSECADRLAPSLDPRRAAR